jgi:uncharacterized protein (TIGR02145 family)
MNFIKKIILVISIFICLSNLYSQKDIVIGNQIWSAENLNVDKFNNGEPIKEAKNADDWFKSINSKTPAWCYPGFNYNNAYQGKLYNYYAVIDTRNLVPTGYHIPTSKECADLIEKLGGSESAGLKLKSTIGWISLVSSNSMNGNNETGFNAHPTGIIEDGYPLMVDNLSSFWTSTKSTDGLFIFNISSTTKNIHSAEISYGLKGGYSIRLIKENPLSVEMNKVILTWKNKTNFTASDCDNLYYDFIKAKDNNLFDHAIVLIGIVLNKCNINDELSKISSLKNRAELYLKKFEYLKAINDLKICETKLVKILHEEILKISIYDKLSECYSLQGDNIKSQEYKLKSNSVWKERQDRNSNAEMSDHFSERQNRKYCFSNFSGKFELTLLEDGSKKVIYKLYNNSGGLQKTIQGVWELRDEGVYGSAYKITISWSGVNSSLPETKYTCQYSGDGTLQNIIDNQNRTWNPCN